MADMHRNPNWARDELILALDLYFRVNPLHSSKRHPAIVQLSQLLNKLPIHAKPDHGRSFRNPDGVYMKLCNFLRFDPDYEGTGLRAGAKLDEEVWNEFCRDPEHLSKIANVIRRNYHYLTPAKSTAEEAKSIGEDEDFPEGRVVARLHRYRERNYRLVKDKKSKVLQDSGSLNCEVCSFDFAAFYGKMGYGFAECHHNKPLSELDEGARVRLEDLAIVCANCHRMLHRTRPWLAVQELRHLLQTDSKLNNSSTRG